ncbi:RagB/SusD family nutrient uptake outer membrane protein [Limibacterium fermenti]|uniref:RagB/SusD family nutrient uptake outer membrane protein n=1 Tax=Limibacterium fermenti TaxID=3229863 RepID=UPI003A724A2A
MKNNIYRLTIIFAFILSGCENFLDTESYTMQNSSNFPMTLEDAQKSLTGIYSTLSAAISYPQDTHFYMAELASDDRFGGGGENDKDMQGFDHLMNTKPSRLGTFWEARYKGIFRANTALETLNNCSGWESEAQKNHFKGEAYFLRALFYFELSQTFGEVPLVLKTEAENIPKTPADETYAQIASDLKNAINMMYSTPYTSVEAGHATKWAAETLMARVFLFYTGYYGKDSLPLPGEEGSVSKSEVIEWLEDCISKSGHDLVGDFRNLWPYTNEYTVENYEYTKGKGLKWEGDGNKETVFAIKFGTSVDWGTDFTLGYSNQYNLHFGLRSNNGGESTFPFGQGWGAGPVNSEMWNEWKQAEPNDLRRTASILDVETELKTYEWGADKQMEETGYWQKKYMPISAYDENKKFTLSYAILKDGAKVDYQLAHTQDMVLIRFADVLLMHSELKQDNSGLTRVRTRVNLPAIPYSLDAIKKERRWELAFEGLRYFDLMRWGDAAVELGEQEGVAIKNRGVNATMRAFGGGYKARYEATGGFWPIPQSQIELSNGVLTQNKGWGTADAEFPGW